MFRIIYDILSFIQNNLYIRIIIEFLILILAVLINFFIYRITSGIIGKIKSLKIHLKIFRKSRLKNIFNEKFIPKLISGFIRIARLTLLLLTFYFYVITLHHILPEFISAKTGFLLLKIYFSVITVFCLVIILKRLKAIKNRITGSLEKLKGKIFFPIKIGSSVLFSDSQLVTFTRYTINIIYLALILLLYYFSFLIFISFFEVFRVLKDSLLNFIMDPALKFLRTIAGYIPSLIFIVFAVIAGRLLIKINKKIFREVEKGNIRLPGFQKDWSSTTHKIIRFFIIVIMIVICYPYLPGSNSEAFRAVSIFLGILFSLGSASVIGNILAGIILTYMQAFKTGDRVKIGDTFGDVIEKNLLITRIRTIKNEIITIPNSLVTGKHIINYSSNMLQEPLIIYTSLTLGYDIPWRKIHELLISAARETDGILQAPEPFVLQKSLNDYSITYELNAYTDKPGTMAVLYSELHNKIQDKCREAGVDILSPMYAAVRDGNKSTIPE